MKNWFVHPDSIVRQVWGRADTLLFIFAGAAAEFALNKAVDWLYFTGILPADPLGRLFSTITYSREIIFSEEDAAFKAIDQITAIHRGVEKNRGAQIPEWAYRDVLYLLIDYTIRSSELIDKKLSDAEKEEIVAVFLRVGSRMHLKDLPQTYPAWTVDREKHLKQNLISSHFTLDLYQQYKKHLGGLRYAILLQVQLKLVPAPVHQLLPIKKTVWVTPILVLYKQLRKRHLEGPFKKLLLPAAYKTQILSLDQQ